MSDPVVRDKPDGVRCPRCGLADSAVVDSRGRESNGWWRRRRECLKCEARWTTMEVHDGELDVTAASIKLVGDVSDAVLVAEINRRFGWKLSDGEAKK